MSKITIKEAREVFGKFKMPFGRMGGGSKRGYRQMFPDNLVVFNARIYDEKTFEKQKDKKIKDFFAGQDIELWYGDIDLNKDIKVLSEISRELKMSLVITRETGDAVIKIINSSWMGVNELKGGKKR